jgi:opacity protein-like surface antigen
MKLVSLAGVASAALVLAANVPAPAAAADLGGYRGSTKDGYVAPMPTVSYSSAGPCYFRGDIGYSWSNAPTVTWPVHNVNTNRDISGVDAAGNPINDANGNPYGPLNPLITTTTTFITDKVTNVSAENTWLAEAGVGCGWGGSRGVRIEGVLGYRGKRKIDGEPGFFNKTYTELDANGNPLPSGGPVPPDTGAGGNVDPLHTSLTTYTAMLNAYKDLGNFGGFVPYVGAGIGAAYHRLDDVYFTGNPNLTNRIHGNNDLSFAWSLMAGVGYQISDRAIIDVGYRYIDLGKISSQRSDSAGFVNPAVKIDDITAHEVKVGLRYHFGGGDCCDGPRASLK